MLAYSIRPREMVNSLQENYIFVTNAIKGLKGIFENVSSTPLYPF